jgi:hypothetical protein
MVPFTRPVTCTGKPIPHPQMIGKGTKGLFMSKWQILHGKLWLVNPNGSLPTGINTKLKEGNGYWNCLKPTAKNSKQPTSKPPHHALTVKEVTSAER